MSSRSRRLRLGEDDPKVDPLHTLLGAIGLESLNLRVDLGRKALVPAGWLNCGLVGHLAFGAAASVAFAAVQPTGDGARF